MNCVVSSRARVVLPEPEQPAMPRMKGRRGRVICSGPVLEIGSVTVTILFRGHELFDGDLGDEGGEEGGELFFGVAAGLHDLLVVDGLVEDAGGHVGDQREAEDVEAHVAGDDDLVDGGHADEVGAEGAEGADLGGGFEAGAEDGEVDAFGEEELLPGCFLDGEGAEPERVGGGHVEEALPGAWDHAEAGFVGAEGGVGSGEVDVVGDGDE